MFNGAWKVIVHGIPVAKSDFKVQNFLQRRKCILVCKTSPVDISFGSFLM